MRTPMETERTILKLMESNAVLEYIIAHSDILFGNLDLKQVSVQLNSVSGLSIQIPDSVRSPPSSPRSPGSGLSSMFASTYDAEMSDESEEDIKVVGARIGELQNDRVIGTREKQNQTFEITNDEVK